MCIRDRRYTEFTEGDTKSNKNLTNKQTELCVSPLLKVVITTTAKTDDTCCLRVQQFGFPQFRKSTVLRGWSVRVRRLPVSVHTLITYRV